MTMLSVVMLVLQSFGILGRGTLGGYGPSLVIAAVIGFSSAFVSLWMSKWIAKMSTGAQVITSPRNPTEAWLLRTVEQHAKQVSINMPEVAIYDSPNMNAFATGPTRNNSLVAI